MGKYAQIICGPAGSGKSTYCDTIQQHCANIRRKVHVINLDPAAETFKYEVAVDIRDLISVSEVMEELDYGPNGGLLYAMEYLCLNLEWLEDQISNYGDDYLLIDCPGQIELYCHLPYMRDILDTFTKWGYHLCVVHLIDSLVITDASRFISGVMMSLSAMANLELSHINILSKCDMVEKKKDLDKYLNPDIDSFVRQLDKKLGLGRWTKLHEAMGHLIQDYNMVGFLPFDMLDEESITYVMSHIDNALQYGEDNEFFEPKEPDSDND